MWKIRMENGSNVPIPPIFVTFVYLYGFQATSTGITVVVLGPTFVNGIIQVFGIFRVGVVLPCMFEKGGMDLGGRVIRDM
jgi:hypothetical protein